MTDQTYNAFNTPQSRASDVNQIAYMLRRVLAKVRTSTLAQVVAVTNSGGVSPVGTVDVQPLVQQTDGAGNVTALPIIYSVPYCRLQGGANAVILDPVIGDIGAIAFADRDISAVIASQKQSPPGSNRRNSLADAVWLGGTLGNVTPTQYLQFNNTGITLLTPNALTLEGASGASNPPTISMTSSGLVISFGGNMITIDGSGVHVHGPLTGDSTATFNGEVKAGTIGLQAHHHTAQGATAPTTIAQE